MSRDFINQDLLFGNELPFVIPDACQTCPTLAVCAVEYDFAEQERKSALSLGATRVDFMNHTQDMQEAALAELDSPSDPTLDDPEFMADMLRTAKIGEAMSRQQLVDSQKVQLAAIEKASDAVSTAEAVLEACGGRGPSFKRRFIVVGAETLRCSGQK